MKVVITHDYIHVMTITCCDYQDYQAREHGFTFPHLLDDLLHDRNPFRCLIWRPGHGASNTSTCGNPSLFQQGKGSCTTVSVIHFLLSLHLGPLLLGSFGPQFLKARLVQRCLCTFCPALKLFHLFLCMTL